MKNHDEKGRNSLRTKEEVRDHDHCGGRYSPATDGSVTAIGDMRKRVRRRRARSKRRYLV